MSLKQIFADRLFAGLTKSSIKQASEWAQLYYVMPANKVMAQGPVSFRYYPWQKDMFNSTATLNVGQKGAQVGYSNVVLGKSLFEMDMNGHNCLYVLPNLQPDARDFSASRFNPAIDLSPYLKRLFSDVSNVGHKRAGAANLYIRGSRSRIGLKSVPAAFIVIDELEEMTQEHIPLALERASGQFHKQIWMISTPWIPEGGINAYFLDSTQEHFMFRCPSCSKYIELGLESVVVNEDVLDQSYYKCNECHNKLHNELKQDWLAKSVWTPTRTIGVSKTDCRGWYVNQLYSPTITPGEMAKSIVGARTDVNKRQELYNSKLGLPVEPEGACVTEAEIAATTKGYITSDVLCSATDVICMGVDIGRRLHYEICKYFPSSDTCKVIKFGTVVHFEELDHLMEEYYVKSCVVDAYPERRASLKFAEKHYGLVKACNYPEGLKSKQLQENGLEIAADRTSWLDSSLGRFKNKTIWTPIDLSQEYKNHIKAPVRILKPDRDGNQVARYEKASSKQDHFAHARNYCEIAYSLVAKNLAETQEIQS
jgi:phage terminase large subunit GpA-like protein